ncbi:MAG TPA: hypothetical protein VFB13_17630 [Reyranella sp.]|nr:hypothetical protein [Reyranella sp.]
MTLQTNQSKPTPTESAVLLKLYDNYVLPCRKIALDGAARVNSAFSVVLACTYAESDVEYARLVRREESWGEFAQGSVRRRADLRQALQAAQSHINRDLGQSHAYEMQQRQAAAKALSDMAYQQQVIAAMNRPITTNCTRIGYAINCSSY